MRRMKRRSFTQAFKESAVSRIAPRTASEVWLSNWALSGGARSEADRPYRSSVAGARVTSAVLENVGFTVYCQNDSALIGMRLVE